MNEASLTKAFQEHLRKRRFTVFKHNDRNTKGIPDTSASRNHKTTWYEFKFISRSAPIDALDWSTVIGKDDMVQLANMVRLERNAIAFYVLFVGSGGAHQMFVVNPSQVLWSVREKKPLFLGMSTTLEEIETWP